MTYRPLYEPVKYRAEDGSWHRDFFEAARRSGGSLNWDPGGILSVMSLCHACGDRTLLSEIRRQPWMSTIAPNGEPHLEKIPPHDTLSKSHDTIAGDFARLGQEEIVEACKGRKLVYITLSGGMDSRVVAALACKAAEEGEIDAKLTAVTWSWAVPNSSDAVYARKAAEILGLEWTYIDYEPKDILRNVELAADSIGCLVPGIHLHRMSWFENVPKDSLVLSASYGDSVGRGEFRGRPLLDLTTLDPIGAQGVLKPHVHRHAYQLVQSDLAELRARAPGEPEHVLREHAMYGHYMRGMIAQAMDLINKSCDLYLVFTSPEVYPYMWTIHPSLRTDEMYASLLEQIDPKLLRLPWARTNRALMGRTKGAVRGLNRENSRQCYPWVNGVLYDKLLADMDIDWFRNSEVFEVEGIRKLCERVRRGAIDYPSWDRFIWLASFRRFARRLQDMGKTIKTDVPETADTCAVSPVRESRRASSGLWAWLSHTFLFKYLKHKRDKLRKYLRRRRALKKYPPRAPEGSEHHPPRDESSPDDTLPTARGR